MMIRSGIGNLISQGFPVRDVTFKYEDLMEKADLNVYGFNNVLHLTLIAVESIGAYKIFVGRDVYVCWHSEDLGEKLCNIMKERGM